MQAGRNSKENTVRDREPFVLGNTLFMYKSSVRWRRIAIIAGVSLAILLLIFIVVVAVLATKSRYYSVLNVNRKFSDCVAGGIKIS
ncbi:unnamed protein product [Soboliphyme baturini]|uniref:SEA domain-containing protein n=1 Tax=Soboliphyme baturini TaxID=241478 RepID=A0A183IRM7_9BILA|nr:unnamed protein product [Soboliphyme baturini]